MAESKSKTDSDLNCFEDILKRVGEFGPFQIRIFALLTLMDLSMGQCMLYFVFANMKPAFWMCSRFDAEVSYRNHSSPMIADLDNRTKVCQIDGSNCLEFDFADDYHSIVSEVSGLRVGAFHGGMKGR